MLIEDLHWAEQPLLDLLEGCSRESEGPLLLIVTARPELARRPGWGRAPTRDAPARAAFAADSGRWSASCFRPTYRRGLREAVAAPRGTRSSSRSCSHADRSRRARERRTAGGRGEIVVPDSVQALLAARIDLLDRPDKEALQTAAVIGRVFWTGPVYELLEATSPTSGCSRSGTSSARRESSIPGEREYAIKHALTREVAYASLPRRDAPPSRRLRCLARARRGRSGRVRGTPRPPLRGGCPPRGRRPRVAGEERELAKLRRERDPVAAAGGGARRRSVRDRRGPHPPPPGGRARTEPVGRRSSGRRSVTQTCSGSPARTSGRPWRTRSSCGRAPSAELYTELALQTRVRAGMWQQAPDPELVEGWIERALELAEAGPRRTRRHSSQSRYSEEKDEAAAATRSRSPGVGAPFLRS